MGLQHILFQSHFAGLTLNHSFEVGHNGLVPNGNGTQWAYPLSNMASLHLKVISPPFMQMRKMLNCNSINVCLLYTSDAADE